LFFSKVEHYARTVYAVNFLLQASILKKLKGSSYIFGIEITLGLYYIALEGNLVCPKEGYFAVELSPNSELRKILP